MRNPFRRRPSVEKLNAIADNLEAAAAEIEDLENRYNTTYNALVASQKEAALWEDRYSSLEEQAERLTAQLAIRQGLLDEVVAQNESQAKRLAELEHIFRMETGFWVLEAGEMLFGPFGSSQQATEYAQSKVVGPGSVKARYVNGRNTPVPICLVIDVLVPARDEQGRFTPAARALTPEQLALVPKPNGNKPKKEETFFGPLIDIIEEAVRET